MHLKEEFPSLERWTEFEIHWTYIIAGDTETIEMTFKSLPVPSAHSFHKYLLGAFYVLGMF